MQEITIYVIKHEQTMQKMYQTLQVSASTWKDKKMLTSSSLLISALVQLQLHH